jgi:hypothetical protein
MHPDIRDIRVNSIALGINGKFLQEQKKTDILCSPFLLVSENDKTYNTFTNEIPSLLDEKLLKQTVELVLSKMKEKEKYSIDSLTLFENKKTKKLNIF